MARYVVGVDGGQTATLAVVCDESGRLLGTGMGGPANHIHEPGGLQRQYRALADATGQALTMAGLPAAAVTAAGLGMTGGWTEAAAVAETLLPTARVVSEWDVVTCLLGARAGQPGVVLIAGTGSVAFGINAGGDRTDAGGWGYFLGDQGSAYDVGHAALRAIVKANDGRASATVLLTTVLAQLDARDLHEVHHRYYGGQIERATIAGLAACVAAAAAQGDGVAQDLLAHAAQELVDMVDAVVRHLWCPAEPVAVCPVGGLFRAGDPLLDPLRAILRRVVPAAYLAEPRFPPVVGCILMALQNLGVPIGERVLAALAVTSDSLRELKP